MLTVAGTVAAGEPRITRLGDYRLDLEPAEVMLVTRHTDKPGMVGRIGALLGEADVNISAMHLGRTRPREDAIMVLALDDDIPARGRGGASAARTPSSTCGRSGSGASAEPDPALVPEGLDATLVLVRHGESQYIVEGRFQGQADTPLTERGARQAALVADRLATPHERPALPIPDGPAAGDRPLPAGPDRGDGRRPSPRRSAGDVPLTAEPGFLEIGQGDWEGLHRDEISGALRPDPGDLASPADRGLGTRRRVAGRGRGAGPTGARDRARRAGRGRDARARATATRCRATASRRPRHPWTVIVGHDGVFKVALLTLFDLPLERFWMWSMDLCAISVIEVRGGQPVIRAFNHTGHLAPLLDEAAVEAQEARSRSGAL